MRITIYGGGNIGTQFAVHCAEQGHRVTVFSSRPERFENTLRIVDRDGTVVHVGEICGATANPAEAFAGAELILVTVPADCMRSAADTVLRYADAGAAIGVVPGNGGSECAFASCIRRGNPFFSIERVPAIARLVRYGSTVMSTGYRSELHVAALPADLAPRYAALTEKIFQIPCRVIPNLLNLTMTPSNPILHTARLRTMFRDYRPGRVYPSIPLFYEDWTLEASELLLLCDGEVQEICRALPELDLRYVKSLREHYESPTAEAMTRKIAGIPAFRGIATPMTAVEGGFIPDLHSRYFTADFSYGLSIIRQIGAMTDTATPNIDEVLGWYESIRVEKDGFHYADYGIQTREDLVNFYGQPFSQR